MKRKSKICSILLVLAMALSLVPSMSFAAGGVQETINPTTLSGVGTTGGTGKWVKSSSTVSLNYNGASKEFGASSDTYIVTPYKEITMGSIDTYKDAETTEVLEDYEKLEFFIGYDENATKKNPVNVRIIKANWVDGVRAKYDDSSITFDENTKAKKIEVALDGFDSVKILFSMIGGAEACEFVVADLKLTKITENRIDRHPNLQNYVQTYYGGYKQMVYGSKQALKFGTGANQWYSDQQNFVTFTAGQYNAVEMDLGYDEANSTNDTGEFCGFRVFTRNGSSDIANQWIYVQRGTSRKVVVSLPSNCTGLRITFARYDKNGTKCDNTAAVPVRGLAPAVLNFKLYKNTSVGSYYLSNSATSAFPTNVCGKAQYAQMVLTSNVAAQYLADKYTENAAWQHKGILFSKDNGRVSTNQTGTGYLSVKTSYVTGRLFDRFAGYIAIPAIASNTNVAASDDDYVKIIGCKYKDGYKYNLNTDVNMGQVNETVLFQAAKMTNAYMEYVDLDVSDYDYIKFESHTPSTYAADGTTRTDSRYVGLFDVVVMKFNSTEIESEYDEARKTVTVQSPALRTTGTLVAVAYGVDENGHTEKDILCDNTVLFGSEAKELTVRDNNKTSIVVEKPYEMDLTSIAEDASYVKLYYVDGDVSSANTFAETGATEEDYLDTYMLSSELIDITSIQAVNNITTEKGVELSDLGLPSTVSVFVGDIEYKGIGVTWASSKYDSSTAGTVTATGTLNAEDLRYRNLSNTNALSATVSITVERADIAVESSVESNIDLNGGGFVTGIVAHPLNEEIVYARTDVGGAYRYDVANNKWISITDFLPKANMYGIDAIAVDPNNENVVYIQAGCYWYKSGHAIYKSTNKGQTWTDISITDDKRVFSANDINRTAGEALLVDPTDSNVIYCGTRTDGLWITRDGGNSWAKSSLPVSELEGSARSTGIRTITADASGNIYAGVYDYSDISGGVYKSTDAGFTWSLMENSPIYPLYIKTVGNDVYVSSGETFSAEVAAEFKKYDSSTSAWIDMTPDGYSGAGSFDTYTNDNDELVILLAESKKGSSLYKKVGNEDWIKITQRDITKDVDSSATWFTDNHSQLLGEYAYVGDVEITTVNGNNQVWITDGGVGIWKSDDAETNEFSACVKGLEVFFANAIDIPNNVQGTKPFYASVADWGMIISDGENSSELKSVDETYFASGKDVESSYSNGNYVVASVKTDDGVNVITSTDAGANWNFGEFYDEYLNTYAKIAVSSTFEEGDTPNIVMIPSGSSDIDTSFVYYSDDFGESWGISALDDYDFELEGLSNQTYGYNLIDSDKVDGNTFYIYNPTNATVYTSRDGGETFVSSYVELLASPDLDADHMYNPTIAAKPGVEGEVWISNSKGLFKSTDYGVTFEKVQSDATVKHVRAFSFGKGLTDAIPSVYILGNVEGERGLFRSDDNGATWCKINNDVSLEINVTEIVGDMNTYAKVYVATYGRGIMTFTKFVESATLSESDSSYIVKLSYKGPACVMAASYDTDGKLHDVKIGESKTFNGDGTLTVNKPEASNETKVFVWESASSMKPIFAPMPVE